MKSICSALPASDRRERKTKVKDDNHQSPVDNFDISARASTTVLKTLLVMAFVGSVNAFAAETLNPKVDAYLTAYCLDCHGKKSTKSDFRIDKLSSKVGFENTPQWLEVIERINSGEMPPHAARVPALRLEHDERAAGRVLRSAECRVAAR